MNAVALRSYASNDSPQFMSSLREKVNSDRSVGTSSVTEQVSFAAAVKSAETDPIYFSASSSKRLSVTIVHSVSNFFVLITEISFSW